MGFGLLKVGLRLRQRRAVGARIDLDEDVAFLDLSPLLEVDLVEVAPGVRPHLDRLDGLCSAGEMVVVGDFRLQGEAHRDGRRRRGRLVRGRFAAADQDEA